MPSEQQAFGTAAEAQAVEFVRRSGMQIHGQHITSRYGEIDILAEDAGVVVAVEVKARRSAVFGQAVEALTNDKLQRLQSTFYDVLQKRGWDDRPYRIDFIAIENNRIEYFRGVG